jgi:hypothetical protein
VVDLVLVVMVLSGPLVLVFITVVEAAVLTLLKTIPMVLALVV